MNRSSNSLLREILRIPPKVMRAVEIGAITSVIGLLAPVLSWGQGGAVAVRIADGAGVRCINGSKDAVWVTLRRVITDKSKGWFKEDSTVAVVINATVRTQPQAAKPINFPLMTEATLRGFSTGQVSVPLEYTIVDSLALKQSAVRYTGLEIEMTLLNKAKANSWGRALQALGEVTKKLPIPSNPYSQTATYLLEFANSAISKDMDDQSKDDKAKSAALAFNFDPTGACDAGTDFEKTGTVAVLSQGGLKGPSYVDINRTAEYCWTAELKPSFILKAAPKVANLNCEDPKYKPQYQQVTNNYVAFFVNAIPAANILGAPSEKDRQVALRRCAANGVAAGECLAARRP